MSKQPVFGRRTALRGAAALAAVPAVPPPGAAAEFPELAWRASVVGTSPQPFRTRVISGVPPVVGYGTSVVLGPVVVQAISDRTLSTIARPFGYTSVSVTVTATVVVTDARGLSGRVPVTIDFPRVTLPTTPVEVVFTGTATLTGAPRLPSVRNPGTLTIRAESGAKGAVTVFKDSGAMNSYTSTITLAGPDAVAATIEVR